MFPIPVEVWGSAPPASQLRLKEARREQFLRSHGMTRYSDILQHDLYRWRETTNSPKFNSLPSALEEEEREREMQKVLQGSRRRLPSGNNGSMKIKFKDIWRKFIPGIMGGSKPKSRERFLSEPTVYDQSDSPGSSGSPYYGSPSLREPEKSILNRMRRERSISEGPKKVVRWADEPDLMEGRSPRSINLSTIDEESGLHRQVKDIAFEEPEPFFELDGDDSHDQSNGHSETWPPNPALVCSHGLNSYSDSELNRHTSASCPCCDDRQAVLANLRSPDAGFYSPESAPVTQKPRCATECPTTTSSSTESPSQLPPVKLPRLASTPSLLPSHLELNGEPVVVSRTGVLHRTSAYASARYSSSHATAHP